MYGLDELAVSAILREPQHLTFGYSRTVKRI